MTFHLWKIKVRAGASLHKVVGIVKEIETKVKNAAADRFRIDKEVLLIQVPASWTRD